MNVVYCIEMRTVCPNCKGKGYVFEPMSCLLTVMLPVALMIGSEMTRKDCPSCDGDGIFDTEDDED